MQAMVLTAGLGTRLRPLTHYRAKPACPVCDHPLLVYPLARLHVLGVTEVVVNTHHLPATVETALRQAPTSMSITTVFEPEILGTGGGLKNAEKHFESDPFILLNGDTICEADLKAAVDAHRKNKALATLVLLDDPRKARYGAVEVDKHGAVTDIAGILDQPGERSGLFVGAHILSPGIFAHMPPVDFYCIIREVYLPLIRKNPGAVHGHFEQGRFLDLGTSADYLAANFALLDDPGVFSFYRKELREAFPGVWLGDGAFIDHRAHIVAPVLIGTDVTIEAGAQIGPQVVLGSAAAVRKNAELQQCVVWDGAEAAGIWKQAIATEQEIFSLQTPAAKAEK